MPREGAFCLPTRTCDRCSKSKPHTAFASRKYCPERRHTTCRDCCADLARLGYRFCSFCLRWQWGSTSFHGKSETRCASCVTAQRYGMTSSEYEWFCVQSGETCQICGVGGALVVDHDHENGRPRGRLCHSCNVGLGHFRDNTGLLIKASEYLTKANERYTLDASLEDVFWPGEQGDEGCLT